MDRPEDRAALIEVLGRDGHVQRTVDVFGWPVTLGRDLRNTVVLDDPHVAPFHARLVPDAPDPGSGAAPAPLRLEVADTRNGAAVGRRRLAAGQSQRLAPGTPLHLGGTTLRVRVAGEPLAPEVPVAPPPSGIARSGVFALLLLLGMAAEYWIGLEPDAEADDWIAFLLGAPAALVLWCGLWALASKLFQQRFDFAGHLAIAAPRFLLAAALGWLSRPVAAALGWPVLAEVGAWAGFGVGAWTLWAHARHVLPQFTRGIGVATVGLSVAALAVFLSVNHRRTDSWSMQRYLSALPTPAARFGPVIGVDAFVEGAARLRAPLEARVARAAREREQAEGRDAAAPAAAPATP